jgi:transposase
MISIPSGVRILIAMRPVDFRSGADRLAALAQEKFKQNPFGGTVLVFRAKRAERVKILLWDGSGLVLIWKRLEKSTFQWPPIADGMMQLSPAQFSALFEGLDWKKVYALDVRAPETIA